ncbi:HEAT repeat domain-containing protein [Anaeromyxobacter paludicola]|uniref:HEAT repeat domain-containing protein n=1 Tax=Anaeromyxobacter paludicola TaxID=2918171 RepID=A0ABN6N3M6_9BACT|nr:HEAT repeat domain-containing protein [Anaeromyxobacter paludicola]BDG07787.1 hypothetical protein AMPC_09000 [Anaeromyxobacter paludicola]
MAPEPREQGGALLAFIRAARLPLYLILLAAVGVALFGGPSLERAVREGAIGSWVLVLAPALVATFIVGFAVYRFALVSAGRYHAGKAMVQVALMVLVFTFVLPTSLERYRTVGTAHPVDLSRYLRAPDPDARAMAAELTRHRSREDALSYVPRLVGLLGDPSPEVRRQAHASLASLAGEDAGGEGSDAAARWQAYWERQGVRFGTR